MEARLRQNLDCSLPAQRLDSRNDRWEKSPGTIPVAAQLLPGQQVEKSLPGSESQRRDSPLGRNGNRKLAGSNRLMEG